MSRPRQDRLTRGSEILLGAADGHRLHAYAVDPRDRPAAAVVILQKIFGVNAHIREVCDGDAERGFRVISPALFDRVRPGVELGYGPEDIAEGRALRAGIGWDAALMDLDAAVREASKTGPVGVVGYCWGGTLAFLAATRLSGVRCAVGYYGGQTVPFAREKPRVPVLLHFGKLDPRVPPAGREMIHRANAEIEIHVFPADHGFNCDHRAEWHDPSAKRAPQITPGFPGPEPRRPAWWLGARAGCGTAARGKLNRAAAC